MMVQLMYTSDDDDYWYSYYPQEVDTRMQQLNLIIDRVGGIIFIADKGPCRPNV